MAEYLVIYRTQPTSGFNPALVAKLNALDSMQFMSSAWVGVWLVNTPLSSVDLGKKLYPAIKAESDVAGRPGKLMICKLHSGHGIRTWGMAQECEAWAARRAPPSRDAAKVATR